MFELSDLRHLSPRAVSGFSLIHMHKDFVSVKDEFQNWLQGKVSLQPKLAPLAPYLRLCFEHIVVDCIVYVMSAPLGQEVLFRLSEKHLLFNFINLLEIMLNEARKKDIALGLFEYTALALDEKKLCADPMLLRKISSTKEHIDSFETLLVDNHRINNERLKYLAEAAVTFAVLYGLGNALAEDGLKVFSAYLAGKIDLYMQLPVFRSFTRG